MPLSHATDALMHGYGAIVTYLPHHSLARSWPRVTNWCVNGILYDLNDCECRSDPLGSVSFSPCMTSLMQGAQAFAKIRRFSYLLQCFTYCLEGNSQMTRGNFKTFYLMTYFQTKNKIYFVV